MQELEHPIAVYWDDDGNKYEIRAEELDDPTTLEVAKNVALSDPSGQVSLSPRQVSGKRSHFLAPSNSSIRSVFSFENNPIHDNRIDFLLGQLKIRKTDWTIVESYYAGGELIVTELFKINRYSWGKEIHRIVSADAVVRHDLFGQAQQIEMSVFRPWIAIEVINTHFPDEGTFQALMALSSTFPFVVLFDCTDRKNYFLKVDNETGTITTRLCLRDGRVWLNGKPTTAQSSAGLEICAKNEIDRLKKIDLWKKEQVAATKG